MVRTPEPIAEFLRGKRIAVVGVSRDSRHAANAVYRKLRAAGYDVIAVNPNAAELEGAPCYPNLASLPEPVDGVVVATRPEISAAIVRQCHEQGVNRVWLHRSLGHGSVSQAAVREGRERGMQVIPGGCPLMYCEPVDVAHKCLRWWTARGNKPEAS